MLLLITILLPLAGGALMPLFRFQSVRKRGLYTESVVIAASLLCAVLLLTSKGEVYRLITVLNGFDVVFRVDDMSRVFAGLVCVLWPFANLYAIEYMENEERQNTFFAFYTMTYGITLGISFAASLFTMYLFFEFMTIVTLPLVVHKHDSASSYAGRKYVYYSISAAALGMIAMIFVTVFSEDPLFTFGGTLSAEKIAGLEGVMRWVFLLAFFGFGVKAAVFPLSGWLPTASVAPTPVTALLHAVAVVNCGAFAVLRSVCYAFGADFLRSSIPHDIALAFSCFTVVYGSLMAVREQHLKKRLAYSTVSNLSYMLMGVCLMTKAGMTGALAHFLAHSFMKITLFYCAGAIMEKAGCNYVSETRGLGSVMPFTCAAFTVASFAMVGVPPFCGFVSKWNLLTAAAKTGTPLGVVAVCAIILSAILTAIYLFTVAVGFYFRPLEKECGKCDPGILMKLPIAVLCAATIVLGLAFGSVITFFKMM